MPKCEHFTYTAAKTVDKDGYQIIAKSSGITNELLTRLEKYLYPLGVQMSDFHESRSLLVLPHNKIAYSIIKNVGIGYDGRRGTIYNQTFVLDKAEFEKLKFDSRIFDEYFTQDNSLRGCLDPIEIKPAFLPVDFALLGKLESKLLNYFLYRMFRRDKLALINLDHPKLIQNLLMILPPELRLIQFSTHVVEPDRQPQFALIQIPKESLSKLRKTYTIMNSDQLKPSRKSAYDDGLRELTQTVLDRDEKSLLKIFDNYERISEQFPKTQYAKINKTYILARLDGLARQNELRPLKNEIQKLYKSKKFTESSPTVQTHMTKKLRKIIQKILKNKKNKKIGEKKMEAIISSIRILLDSMHYICKYSRKPINKSLKSKIYIEIKELEMLLDKYAISESLLGSYEFNYPEYIKWQIEQFANTMRANTTACSLWWMNFMSSRK